MFFITKIRKKKKTKQIRNKRKEIEKKIKDEKPKQIDEDLLDNEYK